jgi:hypothetical protein
MVQAPGLAAGTAWMNRMGLASGALMSGVKPIDVDEVGPDASAGAGIGAAPACVRCCSPRPR